MKKRLLAALLLMAMLVSVLPTAAFADDTQPVEETPIVSEEPAPAEEEPAPEVDPEPSEEPAPEVDPEPSEEPAPEVEEPEEEEIVTEVVNAVSFEDFAQKCSAMTVEYTPDYDESTCAADEYALCRLIVSLSDKSVDLSGYGADKLLISPDGTAVLQFSDSAATAAAAAEIAQLSGINYVEADTVLGLETSAEAETFADSVGQDQADTASTHNSWGISNIGADVMAKYLKNKGYTSTIYVAVVDTGVNASHTYLSGRVDASLGYDFVDSDSNPADENGHGSHCSGTIVDCTLQLTNVKIIPVRVLDEDGYGTSLGVSNGIKWAANKGAKVISLSLGGSHSSYKDEAINYAISMGVTCVVAAGNDSKYVGTGTSYTCPAHIEDAITVIALDDDETDAYYSNYGPACDVSAPGTDIYSVNYTGGYCYMSGTSMATPHVAALCAMLKLLNPSYTPAQIQTQLKSLCRDLGSDGFDNYTAYGIPDMNNLYVWEKSGNYWTYHSVGYVYKTNEWAEIDGSWYHFDSSSHMQTGWQKIDGSWYYLGASGVMRTLWQQIDGNWYYFGNNGVMRTLWQQIDGKWYYFGQSGIMRTDWQEVDGAWYYFGTGGVMSTGWQEVDGSWYYFGASGTMKTGWQEINDSWYYFGGNGVMRTDWQQINGSWYYFGASGVMRTGWQEVDGSWYRFTANGVMLTSWQQINGDWYYFGTSGRMKTGWFTQNSHTFYFKSTGVMARSETLTINGNKYTFDANGYRQ